MLCVGFVYEDDLEHSSLRGKEMAVLLSPPLPPSLPTSLQGIRQLRLHNSEIWMCVYFFHQELL